MNNLRKSFSLFLFILAGAASAQGSVLINEVMYHPASQNLAECYVELFNPDPAAFDLSGCRFTKGFAFTFPANTVLAPGGYLVVAANASAFTNRYPGVLNFVAGWAGTIRSHLRLETPAGQVINELNYSSDGDWAARILTTNGFAAYGHFGWEWYAPHDGLGSSLELINPALPAAYAQNWGASSVTGGTPGRANSIASANIAPLITSVAHHPVIPRPTDVVTVSARLTDEHTTGLVVTLHYRNASTTNPPPFTTVSMFDDGAHNDGVAADGIFGAILPAQSEGTVIEFYLQAQDLEGHARVYPDVIPPANSPRTANLLYQVDSGAYNGAEPLYRIIMTEMERLELYQLGRGCPSTSPGASMDSDAQMNATWITQDAVMTGGSSTQFRYNIGVRNRGHGTRSSNPNNYHVNIPADRPWKNLAGLNLNSQYAYCQTLGSAIFRRLATPMAESRPVQVRINSTNLMSLPGLPDNNSFGSYAANEQYNADFVERAYALDPYGNAYRAIRDQTLCDSSRNEVADLSWHGANYAQAVYTNAYFKQNNQRENDWSDLIDLLAVLNTANGYQAANYASDVQNRVDVDEWMRYMAINTLLDNDETCLANGVGDDFSLYRGTNDTRFAVLPYDLDAVLGRGLTPVIPRHGLFRMTTLPVMDKFMKTPQFAPLYYRWLKTLADTAFAPVQMNPLLDQVLGGLVPQATLDNLKAYNAAQASWVLSQIPLALTVSNSLPIQSGYSRTTVASAALFGTANAVDTRSVLVDGAPAAWVAWQGTWTATVSLQPGINRILVQSLDANGREFARAYTDVWFDDGTVQTVGGTIGSDVTWTAAGGPYEVASTLTIPAGVTLTIEPGTTVYLDSGFNVVINNGGRLLAEGQPNAPILFTRKPGTSGYWGNLTINGALGSPESRIAYAYFEYNANSTGTPCILVNAGTAFLDHLTFGNDAAPYIHVDGASFVISHCFFPPGTAVFEPCHGTRGVRTDGRGVFLANFFGKAMGYSDVVDFTGSQRPSPLVQFIDNVVTGGDDDGFDIDGTDAWIEGNIFLHMHKNGGTPDSSSAVSGGSFSYGAGDPGGVGTQTSQITIIGNIMYDCDQAVTGKEGNFYTLLNNTVVHQSHEGGVDTDGAVMALADAGTAESAGMYFEGNLVYDAEKFTRNLSSATITCSNNLMPFAWNGPGGGNSTNPPLLKYIPRLDETYFTNWEQAQVLRDWFSLLPGSPGRGTGPNGRDVGGVVPFGAAISGEPPGTTSQTGATLRVGPNRSGNGIPTAGWPNGSGYTEYKWRLDGGSWSAATPISTALVLSGLADGQHSVEVSGRNDAGLYQDDPAYEEQAVPTRSRTWVVDTAHVLPAPPTVRLNEILAQNSTTLTNAGTTPDLIELFNYGSTAVDLTGMGLSDNATAPYKYTFPSGLPLLGPGKYLVLYADAQVAAPGIHLGFSLKAGGDDVYLHDKAANGGALLDSILFGVQVPDYSLGRGVDGTWALCWPSFGAANIPLQLDDPHRLRINEWLADEQFSANNDFVELFNPSLLPVALGGCYLSNAEGAPALNPIAALSFIAPVGYAAFTADADPGQGADHLNFKLDPNVGVILLSDAALQPIDLINYGGQTTDRSQGRSPSGSDVIVSFPQPTPGGPNPVPNGGAASVTNITATLLDLLDITSSWRYNNSGGTNLGTTWVQPAFSDGTWASGQGLFGFETTPTEYPFPFRTSIAAPQNGGHITVYYRAHFQWDGSFTNSTLVSTNYVDDGAVFYLNGAKMGSLRMPSTFTYNTVASGQPATEGVPDILVFTNQPIVGDNVVAVEVHQINNTSSDDVFGMQLNAVQYTTNIISSSDTGVPVVLNEILAASHSLTNALGTVSDWIELANPTTNTLDLTDLSLSDDPNAPRKFVFAPGTTIAPGGFLLINCDKNLPVSADNTGFSLNASGGSVYLFASLATSGGLLDAVSFGLQTADLSIGRIPNASGNWQLNVPTPDTPNEAAGLGNAAMLRINEWMADPATGSDWFELFNGDSLPVALEGFYFTDDLAKPTLSPVPPLSFIGAGANGFVKFVADGNPAAGADHVKFSLSKSGEAVGLFSPAGTLIDGVTFGAQQTGVSQGRFPDGAANIVMFPGSATPGESNFLPLSGVVVNEVLTHTDPPLEDAIEFYNASSAAVDISGWFISNASSDLKKYRVPAGTQIAPHGFKVFYEFQFNPTDGSSTPFTLNSAHGDSVYLSEADLTGNLTGYRAAAKFGAAANGVSFGRYTNTIGQVDFVAMSARSFGVDNPTTLTQFRTGTGAPNRYPLVGPVVLNEVMFYPPLNLTEDDTQDEFVELNNITASDVPLFDPMAPTNTWKLGGGIDYTLPQNVTIPAGGFLLLVSFDPVLDQVALAEFRSRYGLSSAVPLFGPYAGHLANAGESLQLYKPDPPQLPPHPDAGFVPYILVDAVDYLPAAPWPAGADGTGASLQRLTASSYANDPANWFVAAPTAGRVNSAGGGDANGDGLPDAWQIQFFGSYTVPQAAPAADPDGDGFNNLQEYLAGTDPTNATSVLKIDSVQVTSPASIRFNAVAGKTYSILYKSTLSDPVWLKLSDVPAQATSGPVTIVDSSGTGGSMRFYRLVTPSQP